LDIIVVIQDLYLDMLVEFINGIRFKNAVNPLKQTCWQIRRNSRMELRVPLVAVLIDQ